MAPTTTVLTAFKGISQTQPKNQNNNDKTPTPRKASVGATTSPGVIQPQATPPTAEAENIRPPPPGISADVTSLLNQDKDARTYEHDRQRAKQAGEWAKRRARKAVTTGGPGVGRRVVAGATHAGRRGKSFKSGKVELDVDVYAVLPQRKDVELNAAKIWDELGSGLLKRVSLLPSGGGGADVSKATPGVRVNLSELVALSQRKPHKQIGRQHYSRLSRITNVSFSSGRL